MERISNIIKPNILSEISRDIGQVFFASMFVGQMIDRGNIDWFIFIGGLILSLISWSVSLIITNINK